MQYEIRVQRINTFFKKSEQSVLLTQDIATIGSPQISEKISSQFTIHSSISQWSGCNSSQGFQNNENLVQDLVSGMNMFRNFTTLNS